MTNFFENIPVRPRRSLLSVPAINVRALEKIRDLDCDGVILDLEDSVAPDMKSEARENLHRLFSEAPFAGRETIIRINPLSTPDGMADVKLVFPAGRMRFCCRRWSSLPIFTIWPIFWRRRMRPRA